MSYPVTDIDGIAPDEAETLKRARIRTTAKLLEHASSAKARKELSGNTGIAEKRLLALVNSADRLRITGVGTENSGLLHAAGVNTVRELMYRNPAALAEAMSTENKKRRLAQIAPSEKRVERWIRQAKQLPRKITY